MYERFFGFREKPFSLLPDPSFLYLGRQHSTAYSMLEYGVLTQAGFTVITGEVGCGKTTLIRHLLNQLPGEVTVGLVSNTNQRFADLLQWVLMAFGLEYRSKGPVELFESFVDFLIAEYARSHRTVLVIDEAQNLDPATLEELRTISNINADKDQVLQMVLVGQPELKTTLERPELRQFAQRVVAHYHLRPFSEDETISYIQHRLAHAGGRPGTFSHDACLLVHRHAGGIPRIINLLCDTTLVYGYAEGKTVIDASIAQSVIDEHAAGMVSGSESGTPEMVQAQRQSLSKSTNQPRGKAAPQRDVVNFDRDAARQLFSHLAKKNR